MPIDTKRVDHVSMAVWKIDDALPFFRDVFGWKEAGRFSSDDAGFSGVVLAMYARAGSQTARLQDVLLALAGVVAFVLSNILYKRMNERPHPLVLNGAQLICAAIALLPAAVALEGAPHIVWTPQVSWSLAYLVVVLSVGASMLWFWILQHGEASRVSAYFFVTPVFGLLLSAVLLGEQLTGRDGVALLVIAAGLWLAARS